MKMNISNDNIMLILILVIGIIIITCFNRNQKNEGFGDLENHQKELETEIQENLGDLSKEDLYKTIIALKQKDSNVDTSKFLTIEQHGHMNEMTEAQARQLLEVELTDNKEKIDKLETQVNALTSDITLKNEQIENVQTEIKDLINNPDIDYSKYILKESIPPVRQCPPCVCPKVSVSAGLCKKCPPPPKCPPPERCPIVKCPVPKPCENKLKCPDPKPCPSSPTCPAPRPCKKPETVYKEQIKYIKVPTFISRGDSGTKPVASRNRNRHIGIPKVSRNIPKPQQEHSELNNRDYQTYERSNNNNNTNFNYNIKDLNSEFINASHPIIANEPFINF